VHFTINETDKTVEVLAVISTNRNPKIWFEKPGNVNNRLIRSQKVCCFAPKHRLHFVKSAPAGILFDIKLDAICSNFYK
jgi:hypothetical protein